MKEVECIFGLHAVLALLQRSPEQVQCLFLLEGRHDDRLQEIQKLAKVAAIPIQFCSRRALDERVGAEVHQGVAAEYQLSKITYTETDLSQLLDNLAMPPFLLILDQVQDPHNLGACLRTANAAGVHAVIAPKDRSAALTATVRKVASGAVESLPFIQVTNLARTLRQLQERGIWLYGMSDDAKVSIFQADLRGSIGLVLGGEGKGLRRLTQEHCDKLLAIPMFGSVASLNVSVATGISLFEAVRQRVS